MERDIAPRMWFRIQGSSGAGKSEIVLAGLDARAKIIETKGVIGGSGLVTPRKRKLK